MTNTLTVKPPVEIPAGTKAEISHNANHTVTVTIKGGKPDQVETVQVGVGEVVKWLPPAGWTSATFCAPNMNEEFRVIG